MRRRPCEIKTSTNRMRPVSVDTVKKPIETKAERWLVRNVCLVSEGQILEHDVLVSAAGLDFWQPQGCQAVSKHVQLCST